MKKILLSFLLITSIIFAQSSENKPANNSFTFDVTADMRNYAEPEYNSSEYFLGVCEAIKTIGKGEFMISPGDIDPPYYVQKTIAEVLGEDYFWYPVLGNHEVETEDDTKFLNKYMSTEIPNLINAGPENSQRTMYSFDFKNAHFIVLNQYYDGNSISGLDGDISDATYNWLENDLEKNKKQFNFVFGHEPLVSMPDYDNGRIRHVGDNLDKYPGNLLRFMNLLRKHKIAAYFCGHTHNYSHTKINDILQIDAGHSRGKGDEGAQSTFLKVNVYENNCIINVYRSEPNFVDYVLTHQFELD